MLCKKLLLVEGSDDQHVMRNLLRYHGIQCVFEKPDKYRGDDIVIHAAGGLEAVLDYLDVAADDDDIEYIGVVVDADEDLAARWAALSRILVARGAKALPRAPQPDGTLLTLTQLYRTATVGVWIMPDNRLPGILEDFIAFLVPDQEAPLWSRAVRAIDDIPEDLKRFPDVALSKARAHTWLAWQQEPGRPLGIAVTARYLDVEAPHARQLVAWVKATFSIPEKQ
jgi:hypothetical protein